jgi:MFS family permease
LHHNIEKSTWTVLFTDRDLFARLWRAALLQFMAQMCGATAIKYYLPTNFLALGLGKELSLLASGIESSLKVGCTIMEMLIIDKVGRRRTLLLGSVVMSVACLVRCPLFHLKYLNDALFFNQGLISRPSLLLAITLSSKKRPTFMKQKERPPRQWPPEG